MLGLQSMLGLQLVLVTLHDQFKISSEQNKQNWRHQGPLHTRAKSCDHIIMRVQKKVSKGHLNTPPKSCSVVMDLQV